MRVNKKAILDTIEWAKTALANGMRVPPVPTSQVTEDILFKRAVVVALWAFWKPEQFQRQQGAGRWKAETPTINKVLSLLQTIDNVPVLDVQVDNDGMLHVKLIGAGVEHTEEDVDGDDDPDALWYTFIYAAFTPDMIAKITGNREKKFATWGYVHSIGGPQFGLGVLKAKTSCVTVRKDGAARPVYGAVVALTNDELDKLLKVALRETGVPHVLATLGVTAKGVKGAQQMYVPVPAPGGAPNGGAGGTRDFEAQDADAAASVRKTVDKLLALPTQADAYLQLLKPQQQNVQIGFIGGLRDFNGYLMDVTGKDALALLGTVPMIAAVKFGYFGHFGHGPFRAIRAVNEEVKNLRRDALSQANEVTPSMEMLAREYNALFATLPMHGGRVPAAMRDVLDSVADFVTKGILSCADENERKLRTKETVVWLVTWGDMLTKLNVAQDKISAFTEATVKLLSNADSTLVALGQGAVFGVGAYKKALAEEVPTSTIAIEDPTYPLGRVPSGENESYFHGSIVEVDFARHLNHTKEDIRECVVRYAYRSGALLEVAVETNGKTQNARVPGTSVVRVLELVTNPVNNTDSTAPVSTEEVPTPKARSASIDIDQWPQWKAKAQAGRALLSYLTQLYKLSGSKENANMSDGIISRLYQHIVPNGSEKYTHNKVGAIIQRADMDEVNRTNVTQQALDFLEQDVSAYSSNLYEQLTQKSGVALHKIDAADDVINALYPEKMRVVKQLYDLSNKLISVRDELNTLRSSTRSAVYAARLDKEKAITDPATRCVFKYCLELLHWESVSHKMARGGKAELMQEIEMLGRAARLDKEKAPSFQQVFDALMQKAKADPEEADFILRGIGSRAYDGINKIDHKWENFLPTMAYQERAYNVREMKVMRYLVAFWEDNLKAMGDLKGVSKGAFDSLTAAKDYATKVGDAIASEKSTGRPKSDRITETDMSA